MRIHKHACTFCLHSQLFIWRYVNTGLRQTEADCTSLHVASASGKPVEQYGGGWCSCSAVQGGSHGPQASAPSGQILGRYATYLAFSQEVSSCI